MLVGLIVVAASSSISFTGGGDRVATVWFANAVILLWLLRSPRAMQFAIIALSGAGLFAAGILVGDAVPRAVTLTLADLAEVFVGIALVRRAGMPEFTIEKPSHLLAFLACAGVISPAISATGATVYLATDNLSATITIFVRWYLAHALGMMILPPILLSMTSASLAKLAAKGGRLETAAILLMVCAATLVIFGFLHGPFLFALMPFLVLAAFRLGFAGAAIANALAASEATLLTAHGLGPIATLAPTVGLEAIYLQVLFAVAVATTLPIAALMQERNEFLARMSRSERRFRTLAESAPVGVFAAEPDGRTTYINERLRQVTTWGDDLSDLAATVAAADRAMVAAAWQQAVDSATPLEIDFRKVDRAGAESWVSMRAKPDLDDDGTVLGWIGTILNINSQYRATLAAQESERRYRLLADNTNDIIIRIGLDGVRRYVSPAAERILGFTPEEMVGLTPVSAIHPEDRDRVQEVARSLLDGAHAPMCTYRQLRKDGSYAWLEATYQLVRDAETNAPIEFVASVRDVASRQRAELAAAEKSAKLEESYRLLQMGEAAANVGHWRLDAIHHSLHWSDEVFRIHGLGKNHRPTLEDGVAAYHPDDRRLVAHYVQRATDFGEDFEVRARICRPDGEVRHVLCIGQAERAPNGQVVGIIGIFQDITRQVATERELIQARDAAQALADSQSAFLAMMSHEIRTPMTGIVGMVEVLSHSQDPDERAKALQGVEQSTAMLMRILDDVLDHVRIEAGEIGLEILDFQLVDILSQVADLFRHAARSKGIDLRLDCPPELSLRSDPTRLRQIVANFVGNAIKFTEVGSIEILAEHISNSVIRVSISDTGIGIEAGVLHTLFRPFVQAESSITRRFGGTGLGLSISARLATALGAQVGSTSTPGEGSCFWLDLPAAPRSATGNHPVATIPRSPKRLDLDGVAPRILVVEDMATTRLVAEAHLTAMGCDVRCVAGGLEALEALADQAFDVMLVDSAMPQLEGSDVVRLAGMMPLDKLPRIIAFTAHVGEGQHRALREAGIDGIVGKPFKRATLCDEVARVLALPAVGTEPAFATSQPCLTSAKADLLGLQVAKAQDAIDAGDGAKLLAAFDRLELEAERLGISQVLIAARFGSALIARVEAAQCGIAVTIVQRQIARALDQSFAPASDVFASELLLSIGHDA